MLLKEDEIVSIEYIGEEETGDIEIIDADGEHQRNYFANGFNVHNSGAMAQYPGIKHKKIKKLNPLHQIVAEETDDTYGLVIYQEQVMQVVRRLGDFTWAQTNEIRKVMSKSGGAEYFMTHYWPPFKEGCMKKGLDEATALKIFKRIMSFGCVTGDTLVYNPYPNQSAQKWVRIDDLYKWEGYASPLAVGAKRAAYVKMQSLSLKKGRLLPNRIAKVFYNGEKEVFKITTDNGNSIRATAEHRFITNDKTGKLFFRRVENLKVGDNMMIDGGYKKESYNQVLLRNVPDAKYDQKECDDFREKVKGEPCDVCKRQFEDSYMQPHHLTSDSPNSRMIWTCDECHKFIENRKYYRAKKDTKGHKVLFTKIVSIESCGFEDVYDLEMEDRKYPTYVANGYVSHNSWAFNKSHSVAYAFVSYICMWLKVKYPIEFCVAYLNKVNDTDGSKIKQMMKEVERLGIPIRNTDVNKSKFGFSIDGDAIVCGLTNIKNVGEKAINTIIENQPYRGLIDFLSKIDSRACNKRSVENLIQAGAFDAFGYSHSALMENIEEILKLMKKRTDKATAKAKELVLACRDAEEKFTDQQLVERKTSVTPLATGKHISQYYTDVFKALSPSIKITKIVDVEMDEAAQASGGQKKEVQRYDAWLCGLITAVDLKRLSQETKELIDKGEEQRYALANLEDDTDYIVLSFKKDVYVRYEQQLFGFKGKVMMVRGTINKGQKKCFVDRVYFMDDLRKYLQAGRKPYDYHMDYVFRHPLMRYFKTPEKLKEVKAKLQCKDLKEVKKIKGRKSMWAMGIVVDIQTFKAKPTSKIAGQEFYWVFFEDETFTGSFMLFPTEDRFQAMKKEMFALLESKEPFLLYVQKDFKFKEGDVDYKQVNIAVNKNLEMKEIIRKPFKIVKKG